MDQLIRCGAVLEKKGDTYETETTNGALKIVARPEVALRNTSLKCLRSYLAELGQTPVAIGRVDRDAVPKEREVLPGDEYFSPAKRYHLPRIVG